VLCPLHYHEGTLEGKGRGTCNPRGSDVRWTYVSQDPNDNIGGPSAGPLPLWYDVVDMR